MCKVTVLNFTGIYEKEDFYKDYADVELVDLKGVSGTNCMCDEEAKKVILGKLQGTGFDDGVYIDKHMDNGIDIDTGREVNKKTEPEADKDKVAYGNTDADVDEEAEVHANILSYGVHFLDNGNYHYMSALFLEQVHEPFSLVVLDHHPDMQRPMFDILSCGGWITEVLDKNPYVRDVHIMGADRKLIDELDPSDRDRVKFYDDIIIPETEYPIYLSIDKDVISRDEIITNWDQGTATIEQVLDLTRALFTGKGTCAGSGAETKNADAKSSKLLGIDICGECATDQSDCDLDKAMEGNDSFNRQILSLIKNG